MFNLYESTITQTVSSFMYKVYAWMAGALALTAITAYVVYAEPSIFLPLMNNRLLFYGLLIAQVLIVVGLSLCIRSMSFGLAATAFASYALLLGITTSVIFAAFEIQSIYAVFVITVGMFGCMALYGYSTQRDLSTLGSILMMGVLGLIIAGIVNMFLHNSMMNTIISFLGVVMFTGLTAYDVQKIKQLGYALAQKGEDENKIALLGALTLYLDFVNLFMYLLSLLGKRKK
jgi:FtsH-binding integral membrane protein